MGSARRRDQQPTPPEPCARAPGQIAGFCTVEPRGTLLGDFFGAKVGPGETERVRLVRKDILEQQLRMLL